MNGNRIIGKKYDRTNECNHLEKTPAGYKYKEVLEYKITIITKELEVSGEDAINSNKKLGGMSNMDDDFFKRMIEKDILDGTNMDNLNDTIKKMTLDLGTKTFIAGINRIFLLRSAALNELDTVGLLNPVSDKHDLSLDDVENVIPYLEVIEKCSNIIEKYYVEKRRDEE